MSKSVFEFRDYKAYLEHVLANKPGRGHGMRTQIARALKVQPGFVSQVLNSGAHFSPEQLEDLNHFLIHDEDESEFLLLLLQMNRAGSTKLKQRLQKQMDKIHVKRTDLRSRVQIKKQLSPEEQANYYSSWQLAAVHILATIPKYREINKIAEYLGIGVSRAKYLTDQLVSLGLLEKKGSEYFPTEKLLYLGKDAAFISKHHANWRVRVLQELEQINEQSLHFSVVVSISSADREKLRNHLATSIEEFMKIVKSSPEEELHVCAMDFFSLEKESES